MVIDRGSVVIGGGEARSCCLFNKLLFVYNFYCFSLKLKYSLFNFSLIFSTCVSLTAL